MRTRVWFADTIATETHVCVCVPHIGSFLFNNLYYARAHINRWTSKESHDIRANLTYRGATDRTVHVRPNDRL